MSKKTIDFDGKTITWNLPLTGSGSKTRIKDATGKNVAVRQTIIDESMIIESQVGYDCLTKGSNEEEQKRVEKKI
jgi:hypothetical protein